MKLEITRNSGSDWKVLVRDVSRDADERMRWKTVLALASGKPAEVSA